jgi:hypothetical protein
MANLTVNLDSLEQSIDTVLRKANSAPLEARYDALDKLVLLAKAAKKSRHRLPHHTLSGQRE